jgi:hypothetical protein
MVPTFSGGPADKIDKAAASYLISFTPKDSGQFWLKYRSWVNEPCPPGKMQAAPPHNAAHGLALLREAICRHRLFASCMALRHCNAITVSVPLPAHARYGGMSGARASHTVFLTSSTIS